MRIKKAPPGKHFRRLIAKSFRSFRRDEDGAAAVEFAIVLVPFLALLFAIIETALVFFAGQVLETAVADSARLILTGQAQSGGLNQVTFKNEVCARIKGLFDCQNGLSVDVRTASSFGGINNSFAPTLGDDGKIDPTKLKYEPGGAGEIVVVRLMYQFPVYLHKFTPQLVNSTNNTRLLMATAAFQNEPF